MYQTLRNIGRTFAKVDGKKDARELLLDPLGPGYDRCVLLVFDGVGNYLRVDSREFSPSQASRIKYKDPSGPSSPTRPLPIIKHSGKDEETVKRLLRTAREIAPWLEERGETNWGTWAAQVGEHPDDPRIVEEASEASRALTVKRTRTTDPHNVFLTLGRETDGEVKWLLDAVPVLLDRALEGIRMKYGKNRTRGDVIAEEVACQVCGIDDREVFGNFNEVKCYNLDKPGMVTGGFGVARPVRNVPVCLECAGFINYGFGKAQNLLKFRAAGSQYLLLPRTGEDEIREEYLELASAARATEKSEAKRRNLASRASQPGTTLRESNLRRITEDEHEILDLEHTFLELGATYFERMWRATASEEDFLEALRQLNFDMLGGVRLIRDSAHAQTYFVIAADDPDAKSLWETYTAIVAGEYERSEFWRIKRAFSERLINVRTSDRLEHEVIPLYPDGPECYDEEMGYQHGD